jgi:hypothetical protein
MNKLLILSSIFLLVFVGCRGRVSGERILFDFESDSELDRLHWKCHTLFSLSDEHVTHGKRSLRMELYPSDYPGLTPMLEENDWSCYKRICFDIFNAEDKQIRLSVRIDDRKDYPDYEDRYHNTFILKPGMNRVSIPMNTLITSGTDRTLDLRKIYRVLVYIAHPQKKMVLYVDYIRLVS